MTPAARAQALHEALASPLSGSIPARVRELATRMGHWMHAEPCPGCALIERALTEHAEAETKRLRGEVARLTNLFADGQALESALRAEVEALKAELETAESRASVSRSLLSQRDHYKNACAYWEAAARQIEQAKVDAHRAGRREALKEVLDHRLEHKHSCMWWHTDRLQCSCGLSALRAEAEGGEG